MVVFVEMPQRIQWSRITASEHLHVCMRSAGYSVSFFVHSFGAHATLHADRLSGNYLIPRTHKLRFSMQDLDVIPGALSRNRIQFMDHYFSKGPPDLSDLSKDRRIDWPGTPGPRF
jgi:hypothetical protein